MANKNLIRQGDIPIGYYDGETVFLDSEFLGCGIGKKLIRRGLTVRWVPGLATGLGREKPPEQVRRVRVYQMKAEVEPARKFIPYARLYRQYGGINPDDYAVVFEGQLGTDNPNELYERFNAPQLPKGYRGHRLSVSDILELYNKSGSQCWYLDTEGFVKIEAEMKGGDADEK